MNAHDAVDVNGPSTGSFERVRAVLSCYCKGGIRHAQFLRVDLSISTLNVLTLVVGKEYLYALISYTRNTDITDNKGTTNMRTEPVRLKIRIKLMQSTKQERAASTSN